MNPMLPIALHLHYVYSDGDKRLTLPTLLSDLLLRQRNHHLAAVHVAHVKAVLKILRHLTLNV